MSKKILGFIPARAGSKRVPLKNIKPLCGKPLIGYTVEAALQSRYIDRVVVSTDSSELADVARQYGAEIPFLRPSEIAQSTSTEMQFFTHALQWFKEKEDYEPDVIVLLYPTSPFRKTATIDRAIELFIAHPEADSLRSITACTEHPYKMWTINDDNLLESFVKTDIKNAHTLSYSMLPEVYIQNASIYITKPSTIYEKGSPTGDVIIPFVMDALESIDINIPLDFKLAEIMMEEHNHD